jgi:outer membrane protein assembly factor BamB
MHVYCDFGAMGTACVEHATGKVRWSRRLAIEHQVGPGSSPVLYGDTLIVVRDGCDQQYLAALNRTTGETVWRTPRPSLATPVAVYRKAFSTPLIFSHDGRPQMVVLGAQWIVSYEPDTGAERWRVDTGPSYSNVSRPVYGDGIVYVATAFGGTRLLAVRVDGRGDVTDTHVAWEQRRHIPKMSSPLLVGGELYVVSDRGVASCLDAHTGEICWSERLGESHLASPLYADGRIYFCGEEGTTTVIEPGRQLVRVAENGVAGRILASPAAVDRSLFLRTATHLYRIERR